MEGAVARNHGLCLMLFVMLVCYKKKNRILIYCSICRCSRISIEKGVKPNRILSRKWVIGILLSHRNHLSTFLCNPVRSMLFLSFSQSFQESKPEKNKMQALVIQIRSLWNVQPLNQQKSSKIKIHQRWGNFIPTTPELYEHH